MSSTNTKPTLQTWDILTGIIKKLGFFLIIYIFGYFELSIIFPLIIIIILILEEKRDKTKRTRLLVARSVALGNEQELILNNLEHLPAWVKFPDVEKVEFLNKIFKQLWQKVNDYAEDLVPKILEPAIQGYVSDFKFDHVVLGNVPLRVDGVEVHESDDAKKVVMDLDISYAGDCYVTFQTFKFTGGIKNIQLYGRLRVVLTPIISKLPLIGGIQVYFTNQPQIDFDLIKATQFLDMPGVRSKIETTTMNIINSMFLYPNAYSINLSQGVNMSKLATFRIEGILRVHVVEAKNLINKDLIGKSDPYVVLRCGSIKVETPVIQNSLNPKWDFWREFEIEANSELKIEVFDKDDGSKDDFLGHAKIDVAEVAKIGQSDKFIPLEDVQKGSIYLRLTWLSLSENYSDLEIAAKEAKLLSPYLHTALLMIYLDSSLNLAQLTKDPPSPFVELQVETQTKQSDPEKDTCNPIWDRGFTFLIHDPSKAVLNLQISDENTKKLLGEVNFKVDSLQFEPKMELKRHTFFCNKPNAEASICCSMKLRILKNNYTEETEEEKETEPRKIIKQNSTTSRTSNFTQSSFAESESSTSQNLDDISDLGQIKISISYSQQRQRLIVEIHEIHLLQKHSHSIEPYVRLILQTDKAKDKSHKTKSVKNSTNPVYHEKFEYIIASTDLDFTTLTLEVKTKEFFVKKLLGKTVISLSKCDSLHEPFTDWFNLNKKKDEVIYEIMK